MTSWPFDVTRLMRRSIREHADDTAVVFEQERQSYAALGARAERLAGGLHGLGLDEGDRVAVLLSNRLEYPEVNVGLAFGGLRPGRTEQASARRGSRVHHRGLRGTGADHRGAIRRGGVRGRRAARGRLGPDGVRGARGQRPRLRDAARPGTSEKRSRRPPGLAPGVDLVHVGNHGAAEGCGAQPPFARERRLQPHARDGTDRARPFRPAPTAALARRGLLRAAIPRGRGDDPRDGPGSIPSRPWTSAAAMASPR